MTSLPLASLVTLLVVLLMFVTGINVALARGRYGVRAPAVTGHDMFERAFRIQMNTLENAALMLPALWLYAGFIDDLGAGAMGGIWLAARVWYGVAYQKSPSSRGGGFSVALLATTGLWLGALWGLVRTLLN
ncbi:MAG: MAPEG family protein [Burkholderiaceae bacterium]|nr:MAPEG family protein [Sulfuritalea sp.]MCF8174255.1 MAPEG family protein [Burkholderiaceae bacterium]MCF8184319.1 MAPEG family protein [Polynucleobacter sp.]